MDAEAKIEAVNAFMRCINRGDHKGALRYLHDDIEVLEPRDMPYAGRHVGHDEFVAMMRHAMSIWKSWRDAPYPYELACVGDVVFREHYFRAEVHGNGSVIEQPFLEVAEFRGDKIARIRPYYFDAAGIRAAVDEQPGQHSI